MSNNDIVIQGGKVLAGATIFIMLFTMLSMMIPSSYPLVEEEPREPTTFEKLKDFLLAVPYNFCIGGVMIILSLLGSYYSKQPAIAGDILRSLGPFQDYLFGFGAMLIFAVFL